MDGNLLLHLALMAYCISFLSIIVNPPVAKSSCATNSFYYISVAGIFIACGSLVLSFVVLLRAYIAADVSFINVAMNCSSLMPIHYRIAAAWGNHEGSILLLSMYLSVASVAFFKFSYRSSFATRALLIQISFHIALLSFIIKNSNPFLKMFPVPQIGLGLNPVLQDSGLVLHPPILYLGHAGCFIIYSIALSWCGKEKFDVIHIQPWILFSLSCLTLGIGMGSWWANKEIGWGGFWFWDPVENISLLPWLTLTALTHCVIVTGRKGQLRNMTVFLGIMGFLTVLFGIFIVRSGLVRSVHAFAQDSERGIALLCIFLAYSAYGFWEFSKTAPVAEKLADRAAKLIFATNCVFLSCIVLIIFTIIVPFIHENLYGTAITINANFFNITFNTLLLCALSLCIFFTRHKQVAKVYVAMIITVVLTATLFYYFPKFAKSAITYLDLLALFGLVSGIYVIALLICAKSTNFYMIGSHFAFGLGVVAISVSSLLSFDDQQMMKVGDQKRFLNFEFTLLDVQHSFASNYLAKTAVMKIRNTLNGHESLSHPELRMFLVEKQMTAEAELSRNLLYDLHIYMNQATDDGFLFSFYYRPMMNCLWTAVILMASLLMLRAAKAFLILHRSNSRLK